MYCLICEPIVKLNEMGLIYDDESNLYIQFYQCPECGQIHYCTSQSGDMIQEYLDLVEWED